MSRSIHETRGDYRKEYRGKRRPEELARIAERLNRKWRLKRRVRAMRQNIENAIEVSAEAIPVVVRDAGPFVHHPAGPDDLRAVMRRLPPGTLDGLAGITLCLGAQHQRELAAGDDGDHPLYKPDPFTGRLGWEMPLPGVFTGLSGGHYAPWSNKIQVFAYVYDPSMLDRSLFDVYLRLRKLATFLHEVAHHHFWKNHDPRGRWSQEDEDRCENQTEALAALWVEQYAIPYLEETYLSEVAALHQWIVEHGGIEIPLLWLASSWLPTPGGMKRASFNTPADALNDLVSAVRSGVEPTIARLGFARDLHFGGLDNEALQIIDGMLAAEPDHPEALALWGDVRASQCLVEAEAFEARLIHWLRSTLGVEPMVHCSDYARFWVLKYEGHDVEFAIIGQMKHSIVPYRKDIDWLLRIEEQEPTTFISRVEQEFASAPRIQRRIKPDTIRIQFKSTELLPESALASKAGS